ncbi:follicle cell protein 3C-1-like [Lasioglossum baleicum]|uniref:follicle cell protein 3C-1-like n=1 Tax=Lasioglossum baleicum TaxID=434251 RepID=UPI003FCD4BF5
MYYTHILLVVCLGSVLANDQRKSDVLNNTLIKVETTESPFGCVCGIFLSSQFKKGSQNQPNGNPALVHDQPGIFPCTPGGNRQCTNKCLDTIIKYLPNSPTILCGSLDRDCHKERAHLFIKNCKKHEWINTRLSAGREYCCKNGAPYKCPIY